MAPPGGAAKYRFTGYRKFLDPDGYPAVTPPWGTLNAIDLNTGKYLWKIPLGNYPELAAHGLADTGSENYGGPVVTAGGLVFIAATIYDHTIRAFDSHTGALLWSADLPFAGNATPRNLYGRWQAVPRHRHQQRPQPQRAARRSLRRFRPPIISPSSLPKFAYTFRVMARELKSGSPQPKT